MNPSAAANKPKPAAATAFHEYPLNRHSCSSSRCINNILREHNFVTTSTVTTKTVSTVIDHSNPPSQSTWSLPPPPPPAPAPTTATSQKRQDCFIITYKNPIYVKDITTCNSKIKRINEETVSAVSVCTNGKNKENVPPANGGAAPSNKSRKRSKRRSSNGGARKGSNVSESSIASHCATTIETDEPREWLMENAAAGRKYSNENNVLRVGNTTTNSYINDLLLYARLGNYKNISEKMIMNDKYYDGAKTRNTMLWCVNDNVVQVGQKQHLQNSVNATENMGNYSKFRIELPISSSFRPLDIARISSYLHSTNVNNKNNFRYGKSLQINPSFRLYTSVSRPLKIRQL